MMAAACNAVDASLSLGSELGAGATSWRGDQHGFQDSDQFLAELCLRNGVTAGGRRTGPVPVEETPQGTLPSPQQEPTLKDTQLCQKRPASLRLFCLEVRKAPRQNKARRVGTARPRGSHRDPT
ncbi:hypothetical protein IscW_ISCW003639 [Ixodes scapularis]|uniref:Uncharacterized protein n=1 Tax=Ixodes scapularis TaxID=6945 RepID=B7PEA7_IXOSC|nr:hypothetical protein IscW_ISCW003639 [Ixodes scapularis]|eukprot:XP_002400709.1 hypothetical protein IscW_ISCW003639 [Ixodes scapularis]